MCASKTVNSLSHCHLPLFILMGLAEFVKLELF